MFIVIMSLHSQQLANNQKRSAFTFIELLIVIGVIGILLTFVSFNSFASRHRINLDNTINLLITELKNQQNKAMTGNRENRPTYDAYGIYFSTDRYILFHGPMFKADDSDNYVINLDPGLNFSVINLPDSQIIFTSFSGEIANFNPAQASVTIVNQTTGQQKTIILNRYGVVTSVN